MISRVGGGVKPRLLSTLLTGEQLPGALLTTVVLLQRPKLSSSFPLLLRDATHSYGVLVVA